MTSMAISWLLLLRLIKARLSLSRSSSSSSPGDDDDDDDDDDDVVVVTRRRQLHLVRVSNHAE